MMGPLYFSICGRGSLRHKAKPGQHRNKDRAPATGGTTPRYLAHFYNLMYITSTAQHASRHTGTMTSPNITKTNQNVPVLVQPPETSSFASTLPHWFSPRPAPDALWSRGCCHGWGQPGLSVTTPPPTQRCCSCCYCTLLTVSKSTHIK